MLVSTQVPAAEVVVLGSKVVCTELVGPGVGSKVVGTDGRLEVGGKRCRAILGTESAKHAREIQAGGSGTEPLSPPLPLGDSVLRVPDAIPREGSCAVVRGSISMQAWLISFQVAKQSTVRIEIRPGCRR